MSALPPSKHSISNAKYAVVVHPQLENLAATDLSVLPSIAITDLRSKRSECVGAETDISFVRRLAQGRLDIVGHEVQRRAGGSEGGDINEILFEMPTILSDGQSTNRPGSHAPRIDEPSATALELVDRLDQIVSPAQLSDLGELQDSELSGLVRDVQSFEQELSTMRRDFHRAIDGIQAEIVRRYRDGEASVDTLLQ